MSNDFNSEGRLITSKDLMTTTRDYDIFRSYDVGILTASVAELVKKGYVPAGNVTVVTVPVQQASGETKEKYFYVQAVYKPAVVATSGGRKAKLNIIGKCPCCKEGDVIYKSSGSVKCQNKDCNAEFFQIYGQKLAEDDAKAALAGEKVVLYNLPRKDGTSRDVIFHFTGGKVENAGRIWMQYQIEDKN